jgi:hypothetical protein
LRAASSTLAATERIRANPGQTLDLRKISARGCAMKFAFAEV